MVSYVLLASVSGRRRQIHPLMWIIAVLFLVYFLLNPLEQIFG